MDGTLTLVTPDPGALDCTAEPATGATVVAGPGLAVVVGAAVVAAGAVVADAVVAGADEAAALGAVVTASVVTTAVVDKSVGFEADDAAPPDVLALQAARVSKRLAPPTAADLRTSDRVSKRRDVGLEDIADKPISRTLKGVVNPL